MQFVHERTPALPRAGIILYYKVQGRQAEALYKIN